MGVQEVSEKVQVDAPVPEIATRATPAQLPGLGSPAQEPRTCCGGDVAHALQREEVAESGLEVPCMCVCKPHTSASSGCVAQGCKCKLACLPL